MTALRIGAGALLAALVGVAVVFAAQPSPGAVQASSPLLGKKAPPLSGPYLAGAHLQASQLKGEWVVVNFFASWCVDCRIEAAALDRFAAQHPQGSGVQMVMVAYADPPQAAAGFLRLNGGWPAIEDPGGQIALDWGVREPPETFVVAPDDRVVARFIGPVRASQLDSVLAGRVS